MLNYIKLCLNFLFGIEEEKIPPFSFNSLLNNAMWDAKFCSEAEDERSTGKKNKSKELQRIITIMSICSIPHGVQFVSIYKRITDCKHIKIQSQFEKQNIKHGQYGSIVTNHQTLDLM